MPAASGSGQFIEAESFRIISGLLTNFDQTTPEWPIIRRMVHTAGDPAIARHIRFHREAVSRGVQALRQGRPIITDVKMVAVGVSGSLVARLGCQVVCSIDDPAVDVLAQERRVTRSAAGMRRLSAMVPGAVVAIGNAPTALFTLLDSIEEGLGAPALVIGTPVGFVGAAEAKARLMAYGDASNLAYISIEGTRGGSALAACAVNALLRMAVEG